MIHTVNYVTLTELLKDYPDELKEILESFEFSDNDFDVWSSLSLTDPCDLIEIISEENDNGFYNEVIKLLEKLPEDVMVEL